MFSLDRRDPSPDAELLLAAARLTLERHDIDRAHEAMSRGIDWSGIIPLARHHGVLPLLYRHVSSSALDAGRIPDATVAALRREAGDVARRSLFLAGELGALLGELDAAGIDAVCLKGPVLAQQLYGSVSLRRFNDLDLLVSGTDLEGATAVIARRGYGQAPSPPNSQAPGAFHREAHHEIDLFFSARTHRVELHYYLLHPLGRRRFTMATIEQGLERVPFFNASALVMRSEELLAYMCVHGAQHAWERIEWVTAVAELLRSGRVADWERVRAFAQRLQAERVLTTGLYLARDLLGAPIPPAQLADDSTARSAARSVASRLTHDPKRRPGRVTVLVHQVRTDTAIRARLARLWLVLAAPGEADVAAFRLPRALWPLYWLLRPPRLVARWLRGHGRPEPVGNESTKKPDHSLDDV